MMNRRGTVLLAALAMSCAQRNPDRGGAAFTVQTINSGGAVTSVTLEIQPANINASLAYDSGSGNFAGAFVDVPAGVQTFTATAYAGSTPVGTASTTATIQPGETVNVFIAIIVVDPGPAGTHAISGAVSGDVVADVTVWLWGSTITFTTTDAYGNYAFGGLADGSYTLGASRTGYTFSPEAIPVDVSGANVSGADFTASAAVRGSPWTRIATGMLDVPQSVWGSGPDDVWVVGGSMIRHWDGSGWSDTPTGTRLLNDVWGTASNDVWVVGGEFSPCSNPLYGFACSPTRAAYLHWEGSGWASGPVSGDSSSRVWGSAANDVWAASVGQAVMHWDGVAWASVETGGKWNDIYNGIWGSGASDVWFVGGPMIRHWNGSAWSDFSVASTVYLWDVWGSGPSDVWAVGNDSVGTGLAMHWDGASWSRISIGGEYYGIWGSAADDVWVVGAGDVVQHWNGVAWSSVPTGTGAQSIQDVWGSGPDLFAIGWDSTPPGSGLILHYRR